MNFIRNAEDEFWELNKLPGIIERINNDKKQERDRYWIPR
jgi:hypothetical protein